MTKKKSSSYSERMTVNLTPEQMRRLEELCRVRARTGVFVSKNDLIRQAVNHYLAAQEDMPGSRRAIARGLEGRIEALDGKVEGLAATLNDFIERVTKRR